MISIRCAAEGDRRSRSWLAGEYLGRNLIPPKGSLRHFSETKVCYLTLFLCSPEPGSIVGVWEGCTRHWFKDPPGTPSLFSVTWVLTQMCLPERHPTCQLHTTSLPPVCFICFEHLPHESWSEKLTSSLDCRGWDLGKRKEQN